MYYVLLRVWRLNLSGHRDVVTVILFETVGSLGDVIKSNIQKFRSLALETLMGLGSFITTTLTISLE